MERTVFWLLDSLAFVGNSRAVVNLSEEQQGHCIFLLIFESHKRGLML
jgi:hypothetical protein